MVGVIHYPKLTLDRTMEKFKALYKFFGKVLFAYIKKKSTKFF